MRSVRGRLAPLAVRPFSRLLSSYTLNELGDSVGIVALAVLVYDRTEAVAPTAAFFLTAKFLPALIAPALTARFDQVALRKSLPGLYVVEALAFAALALVAGAALVLAEAGAVVTDPSGRPLSDRQLLGSGAEFQMSVVATANAALHERILASLDAGMRRVSG